MTYRVCAYSPMYMPLGIFKTKEEAENKAKKALEHHSAVRIYEENINTKEINIYFFERV